MRRIAIAATSSVLAASLLLCFGAKAPDLTPGQLRQARGGDSKKAVCQADCAVNTGWFVGCPLPPGVDCRLCVVLGPNGYVNSTVDDLCGGTSKPGKKKGNGTITCGEKWAGNCIWNGTSWVCSGGTVGAACVTTYDIRDQVKGDPGYDGPDDP